jgi:hypothetical protein
MLRSVLAACVLLIAACGDSGSEPAATPDSAGGARTDEQLLQELDVKQIPEDAPLQACDGRTVEVVEVSGEQAMETWRKLRDDAESSRRWPVLIGPPEDAPSLLDMVHWNCKDGFTYEGTLARAAKLDVERTLARVARAYGVRAKDLRGSLPLPDQPPSDEILTPFELTTNEPLPKVRIALLPIDASWKAPAFIPFGHYNDNPPPQVHVAALRDWHERYGSEVVAVTGSVIELEVSRPPTTDKAALALAREQFRYAPDIVQQGTSDVETLAALLKDGHAWYFWWD